MSSSGGPRRNPMGRQASISSLEQSLNMVSAPPAIAPVTIYPGPGAKHANLAKADLEIVQRLQQLRQGGGTAPTESEMEERLAKLRDLPTDYYSKKPASNILLNTDRRSEQQKTDDLLSQIADEMSLEQKLPNPDEDIAARLAQLRCGIDVPPHARPAVMPTLDSPTLPDHQDIKQLLKEVVPMSSQSCKKREKKESNRKKVEKKRHLAAAQRHKISSSTEEEERYSNSSDEGAKKKQHRVKKHSKSVEKAQEEEDDDVDPAEVERLVAYYTKRAQDKKKKKKGRSAKGVTTECVTDSSSELSDSGDATSDSEKLSRSSS